MIPVFQAEVKAWLKGLKSDALSSGVGRIVLNAQEACKIIPLRAIPLSFYGKAYTEEVRQLRKMFVAAETYRDYRDTQS
jgi:hypothetical protein